jgi:nucleoside-diphosphate-sugar epimerase
MSLTYFVTGGTGFIGSRLVRRLIEEGHSVRLLARDRKKAERLFGKEVAVIVGDVGDERALRAGTSGADCVFHLAAQVGDFGPRRGFYDTNVRGTQAVVDAADRAHAGRFVFMSTNAVTGMRRTTTTDESAPYATTGGHYGISKGMAERIIRRRHEENGFPAVILRPPIVYGPGSHNWVVRPLVLMGEGKMVLIDGGRGLCWHLYVDNLVDAAVLAARHDKAPGEVFIVGDGKDDTTWGDYFGRLAKMAGYGPITKNLPKTVAQGVARVSYGLYTLFGMRPVLTPLGVGIITSAAPLSIDKARRLLGYRPRVDLDEGMARIERWLKTDGRQYLNSAGTPRP